MLSITNSLYNDKESHINLLRSEYMHYNNLCSSCHVHVDILTHDKHIVLVRYRNILAVHLLGKKPEFFASRENTRYGRWLKKYE
jgi:hypothetical protein